jgi:hypothetical protein
VKLCVYDRRFDNLLEQIQLTVATEITVDEEDSSDVEEPADFLGCDRDVFEHEADCSFCEASESAEYDDMTMGE